jgi:hypothetical protein
MAKTIKNMKDLEKALQPVLLGMADELAERVYEVLNYFLQEYYNSYDPKSYRRQYDFLRSAVKIKAKMSGNKAVASVFIDTDYMDSYYNATGYQVAAWANQGTHGGLNTGSSTPHVWDDTLNETVNNGELLKLAVEYLESKGIPVTNI